jgi:hypothetical protein
LPGAVRAGDVFCGELQKNLKGRASWGGRLDLEVCQAAWSRWGRGTIGHEELIVLIDQIYEAALDGGLWPGVLIKLADAIGAAHVSITSGDRSANTFASIIRARIQKWHRRLING